MGLPISRLSSAWPSSSSRVFFRSPSASIAGEEVTVGSNGNTPEHQWLPRNSQGTPKWRLLLVSSQSGEEIWRNSVSGRLRQRYERCVCSKMDQRFIKWVKEASFPGST